MKTLSSWECFLLVTVLRSRNARAILILDMANDGPQNYWQNPNDDQTTGAPEQVSRPELQPQSSQPESFTAQTSANAEFVKPQLPDDTPDNPPVTWSAQEYIHLDRTPIWFVLFIVIVLGLVAASIFLLRSWSFSVLIVVMAIALIVYIRRPPRVLTYALSPAQGLYVGERLYHFDEFKAFGLIQDGNHHSIMLIPRKRFAPGVSVYFPEDAGERIVDILGQRLPLETLKLDIVDVIVRKLRL